MATLKINRLYVGLSLILALVFGVFIVGNAMNTKEEPAKQVDPPADGWYSLHYIDPNIVDQQQRNDPSNLAIGTKLPSPPSGACDQSNIPDIPCSAEMQFSSTSTLPTTLKDAQDDTSIDVNPDLAWSEEE